MKRLLLIFSLLLLPFPGYAQEFSGDTKDIEAILNAIDAFSGYVMEGDYEAIANSYTSDAKILLTGPDIIEGRDKIREYWTPGGISRTVYHKIFPAEISVIEDTAYDMGRYEGRTLQANGEEAEWKGKYVIVWKKIDDSWKIYIDIWNRTN